MFKSVSSYKVFSSATFRLLKIFLFINLLFAVGYSHALDAKNKKYDLLLAGGGLKTCSSMAVKNCRENIFSEQQKSQILYQLNDENIKKFTGTPAFLQISGVESENINTIIMNMHSLVGGRTLTRGELRDAFEKAGALTLYRELPDSLYYAMLDSFEVPQTDSQGVRIREVTALAQNKNTASVEVYQHFVAQSRMRMNPEQAKPRIAVVTASSRDPFEVADFYLSVFEGVGAEVIWLPLDKTYRQAQELSKLGFNGCYKLPELRAKNLSFYREDIYPKRTALQKELCLHPEKMRDMLNSVQGIFFNGGDQSLTLAALKNADGSDSPELALIRKKVTKGELIVGGTSAGTAVQGGGAFNQRPVPMITNGHSEMAMTRGAFATPPPSQRCAQDTECGQGILADDLTYLAQGGTGLFNLGVVDTHFSERDRETRLAMFAHMSGQRLGFGVDEATALMVGKSTDGKKIKMSVVGENGVFIVDTHPGQLSEYKGVNPESGFSKIMSGVSHYLNTGTDAELDLNDLSWTIDFAGKKLEKRHSLERIKSGVWRDETRNHCGSTDEFGWRQFDNVYRVKGSAATEFFLNEQKQQCSYRELPFVIAYAKSAVNQ